MKRVKFIISVLGKQGVIIEALLLVIYVLAWYATADLFISWLNHKEITGISFAEFAPSLGIGIFYIIAIAFAMRHIWSYYKRENAE